jgi:hypothetical protein
MSAKTPTNKEKKTPTVFLGDPASRKGTLKTIGGSQSDH